MLFRSKDHFPHEKIPEGVHTEFPDHFNGIGHIADAFGHFTSLYIPKSMDIESVIDIQSGRLEHDGPVNTMGFDNILCYKMPGGGPEFFVLISIWIAQGGDIVYQCIKPDIGHIVLIKGEGNPPGKSGLGPGTT